MKKILLLLLTSSLFSGVFDGLENPNGKPFTLNLSAQMDMSWGYGNVSFNLPINSWITIKGIYFKDYYETTRVFQLSNGNVYGTDYRGEYDVYDLGLEVHLPLYKLWEI